MVKAIRAYWVFLALFCFLAHFVNHPAYHSRDLPSMLSRKHFIYREFFCYFEKLIGLPLVGKTLAPHSFQCSLPG